MQQSKNILIPVQLKEQHDFDANNVSDFKYEKWHR